MPEKSLTNVALGAFAVIDKPFDMGELGPLAERASDQICVQSGIALAQ
jgi:hypothetical protein